MEESRKSHPLSVVSPQSSYLPMRLRHKISNLPGHFLVATLNKNVNTDLESCCDFTRATDRFSTITREKRTASL